MRMREAAPPRRVLGVGHRAAALTEPPEQLHSQGSIDNKQEHEKQAEVPYLHGREAERGQGAQPAPSPTRDLLGSSQACLEPRTWPPGLEAPVAPGLPGAQGPSLALTPALHPGAGGGLHPVPLLPSASQRLGWTLASGSPRGGKGGSSAGRQVLPDPCPRLFHELAAPPPHLPDSDVAGAPLHQPPEASHQGWLEPGLHPQPPIPATPRQGVAAQEH